nr:hypothetical protein KXZ65_11835 [Pectobacterium sp. PL152]
MQNQFATIVEKVESIKSRYQQSLTELEALYGALSQQAFKGELDLSRVPLPDQPVPQLPPEFTSPSRKKKRMLSTYLLLTTYQQHCKISKLATH